jgi:spore germination protein YaaH
MTAVSALPKSSPASSSSRQAWVWLWENYSSGLAAIAQHPRSLTTVSPDIYYLSDNGTFVLASTRGEVCGQVHSMGLQCEALIQND